MSITTTTTGPFFATGPIKYSDLRRNFRARRSDGTFATDNNPISMSDLLRVVGAAVTDPIIPDVTANAGIGTTTSTGGVGAALSTTPFRDAIKYITVTQTGTDSKLDISDVTFNGERTSNIIKVLSIEGNVTSDDTAEAALTYNSPGDANNLTFNISGIIYGCGAAAGANGGHAMSVSSTGNEMIINVLSGARIYGGGGGGGAGGNGGSGGQGGLGTFNYGRGNVSCGFGCRGVVAPPGPGGGGGAGGAGGPGRGANNQTGSLNGGNGGGGGSGGQNTVGAPCGAARSGTGGRGGSGGAGGAGGDWGQPGNTGGNGGNGSPGSPGTGGLAVCGGCCPKDQGGCGVNCAQPTGGTGGGGSGGGAGSDGGTGGRAINGSNYRVQGVIDSSTIKGATS